MVTLVKAELEKRVFVDKAETMLMVDNSTLEITEREYRIIARRVKAGEVNGSEEGITISALKTGGFVMQSGSGGKIVLSLGEGEKDSVVLAASWNPQTWFSGQNVVPGVCSRSGGMLMGLADIVEYPFRKLMELCGRKVASVINNVNYGRLDFTTYTSKLESSEEILKFFTSACGMQYFSGHENKFVGIAHMLGFGFSAYTAGELAAKKGLKTTVEDRLCGIVFKKYVGAAKNKAFTLSIYDKTVEVEDKVAALKDPGKKPRILSRNEAMIRELEAELSGRLRVEGQVYPDTFLRGLAARFRSFMMDNAEKPEWMGEEGWERIKEGQKMKDKSGKVVADSYYRKSRFLRDSRATEATLGKIIQEMTRQLGLPVIFEAPSQKTFMRRVGEEVEKFIGEFGRESDVRGLMKEWAEGKDVSERALSTTCMPYKLRSWFMDSLGVDLFSCKDVLPKLIRSTLKLSTLTEDEFLQFIHDSNLVGMNDLMIARAKELRNKMKAIPYSPSMARVSWE